MLEKKYTNVDLEIELTSFIDSKQNFWFRGEDIAEILGYSKPRNAIERHVSKNHKMIQLCWGPETWCQQNDTRGKYYTVINEAGFYELVFSSKLEAAKKFSDWVFSKVLPSNRKYGQ